MYQYFAEDGTRTEDCTEARTLQRSGSIGPRLRLVWDGAPSADELYERLVALLSPAAGDDDTTVLSKDELLAGSHDASVANRPFVVRVADDVGAVEERIAEWLAAPNPSFGGDCPGDLLRGDANGRCRLGYMIAEIEQGAFS